MQSVFITGANGFVGLNIVSQLLQNGYEVRAYVRPQSEIKYLAPMGVSIHRGELNDAKALDHAMRGCTYVIHTAGNTSCYEEDLPVLERTNVGGTRSVVSAAIRNNIERLVFTSTTSSIGAQNNKKTSATEDKALDGFRAKSPYARTKLEAENIVLDARNHGLECVILNLAEVVGSFDHNLQWGRMVLAVAHNQVPFIPPGGGSFCSANETARAHVNALTKGRDGQRYIISGVDVSFSSFIYRIGGLLDKTFFAPSKNYFWLLLKAWLYEKASRFYSTKPLVDPYRMRVFGGHYFFSSDKAQRELDYRVVGLDDMLTDSITWYRENGFI